MNCFIAGAVKHCSAIHRSTQLTDVLHNSLLRCFTVELSSYKIDYVIVIKNFLNPEGHQNRISGSKVTAVLLVGWILPIGGVASERVCACSLRSRLVFTMASA